MNRVFRAFTSETPPSPPDDPQVGYPRNGNPQTGEAATRPGAYWYHMITESLRRLVTDAEITPDHTNLDQVKQAVDAVAARRAIGRTNGIPVITVEEE